MRDQTLTPPASPDSERSILGGIILDNELFYQASSSLHPEDFYLDSHRRIYVAMNDLTADGKPIEIGLLTEELGRKKELESVGGMAYLADLTDGVPKRESIEYYVQLVKDKSKSRQIINVCNGTIVKAFDGDKSDDLGADLTTEVLDIVGEANEGIEHISEGAEDQFGKIQEARTRGSDLVGLPTGVQSIDSSTGGIREGEIWVVGARPSVGKSAFGMQVTVCNVNRDIPMGWFSVEMTREQFRARLWSQRSGLPSWLIRHPANLGKAELEILREEVIRSKKLPLHVDYSSDISISKLVSRAVLMVKRFKIQLLVVDYLGKISAPGKSEYEQVTNAMKGLTRFAKDYCPVLLLSQLARPTEHNIAKRPNYLELKSTGQIEADAHSVLLLHRFVDDREKYTDQGEIIIAKQREGEQSIEEVRFNKEVLRFEDKSI